MNRDFMILSLGSISYGNLPANAKIFRYFGNIRPFGEEKPDVG